MSVLSSSGTGVLVPHGEYPVGERPIAITAGDVDADGDIDLLTADLVSYTVSVLLNDGRAVFVHGSSYPAARPRSVAVADFDRDGDGEIAIGNSGSGTVAVLRDGVQTAYPMPGAPTGLAPADFDGDGDLDLAVSTRSGVAVLLNLDDGTFSPAVAYGAGNSPWGVTSADVDADGDLDLAVPNMDSHDVSILLNAGSGRFDRPTHYPLDTEGFTEAEDVALLDLDGDRDLDMVVGVGHQPLAIGLLNHGGRFGPADYLVVGSGPVSVEPADMNSDRRVDLVVSSAGRRCRPGLPRPAVRRLGDGAAAGPGRDHCGAGTARVRDGRVRRHLRQRGTGSDRGARRRRRHLWTRRRRRDRRRRRGDTICGGPGDDLLAGDAGGDHVDGNDGNDTFFGGPGDDDLVGGPGMDRVAGGAGANRCSPGDLSGDRTVNCQRA